MQIETKFNVGDELWFIDGKGQILDITVLRIDINVKGPSNNQHFDTKTVIEYRIGITLGLNSTFTGVKENQLYRTKQEAGEAWMESQGLKCGVSIAD